ncbi:uncharacterized protein A4U43_UnF8130 [Asparagus officinalis]|uniref:Uncharacterized protein n=1 Tax=Asparagus officinalis TaxID=4686 RepID=A0A1R3L621_ASPOF|nr:uncharacterized protein A4U43_UnF8130 [Asparagus officinalis]
MYAGIVGGKNFEERSNFDGGFNKLGVARIRVGRTEERGAKDRRGSRRQALLLRQARHSIHSISGFSLNLNSKMEYLVCVPGNFLLVELQLKKKGPVPVAHMEKAGFS